MSVMDAPERFEWDTRKSWFSEPEDHTTCELIAVFLLGCFRSTIDAHDKPPQGRILAALHIGISLGTVRGLSTDIRDPGVAERARSLCSEVGAWCSVVLTCPGVHSRTLDTMH